MYRAIRWATVMVAFGMLLSASAVRVVAEEAKKGGGKVSGTVVNKEGKPVSGVPVSLFPRTAHHGKGEADKSEKESTGVELAKADKSKGDKPIAVSTATTDSDGKFVMADVPAGEYFIAAKLKGQGNARENVNVTAGQTTTIELKLGYHDNKGSKTAKAE